MPVPFEQFMTMLGGTGCAVTCLGFVLLREAKVRRWTKGWFVGCCVLALMAGGYAAAGTTHYLLNRDHYFFEAAGYGALFGFLSGLLIGLFIWRYYGRQIEGDPDER